MLKIFGRFQKKMTKSLLKNSSYRTEAFDILFKQQQQQQISNLNDCMHICEIFLLTKYLFEGTEILVS